MVFLFFFALLEDLSKGILFSRIFSCLFVKRFPTYALSACSIIDILFTDDILLFTRAIRQEVDNLLHILQSYVMASGQSINLHKSHILFSKHTPPSLKRELLSKFHMQ